MKNALLITWHFPPMTTVGSIRPEALYKYLPEFGWQVHVLKPNSLHRNVIHGWGIDPNQNLTTQLNQLKQKTHGGALVDLAARMYGELFFRPDPMREWYSDAIAEGADIIAQNHIQALISSGPPATCHLIASELQKFGLRWIADYRDLWSQNHYYPYGPIRRNIESKWEKKVLAGAIPVTVSEPLARKLGHLLNHAVYTIPTGINPKEVNDGTTSLTPEPTLTYTGTIYHGRQDLSELFHQLEDYPEIHIRFYGPKYDWLENMIRNYQVNAKQYGVIPHSVCLQKQRESHALLLLNWTDPHEQGITQQKTWEYLAARRPIISTPMRSRYNDLGYTMTFHEWFHHGFKSKESTPRESNMSLYTQRQMSYQFAQLLNGNVALNGGST